MSPGRERCLRSHVEAMEATELARRIGTFYQNQRVLDYDEFAVTVVA